MRDLECGITAIDCGADAVYVGAARFGAREAAGNSIEDIAQITDYAHRYWAKVYATVNTLLFDEEIPQALELIGQLHEIGIDGLIIQDLGLLECDLPPVPIIASTQMHNSTPERVRFLERVGIRRAILARELDIEQIKAIREATTMELEFFIHGALCVCYSGQCYLSCALGGRSGNRGQCAQPCRKSYMLLDGRGNEVVSAKHLLSIKDLNLSEHLGELIDAGVTSFKVEGRLKDKSYVANVVAHYRALLDEAIRERGMTCSSSGTSTPGFAPNVYKTFNRGYCTHFLKGRGDRIGSIDTPKMVGEPLGQVAQAGRRSFKLDSTASVRAGDGISFFDRDGSLSGTTINGVEDGGIVPYKMDGIRPGLMIYRNHDHEFLTALSKSRPERRIGVTLTLRETDEGFAIEAVDEDDVRAAFTIAAEKVSAEKPEQALLNIKTQLSKTGGTEFDCREVIVELPEPRFLPMSILNALRRGALDELRASRTNSRPVERFAIERNNEPFPQTRLTFEGNVLNGKAEAFYRRHGVTEIEPAAESGIDLTGRKVMTTRYCLKHQLGVCKQAGPPEPLQLVDEEGNRLELRFDCAACEMSVYLAQKGRRVK